MSTILEQLKGLNLKHFDVCNMDDHIFITLQTKHLERDLDDDRWSIRGTRFTWTWDDPFMLKLTTDLKNYMVHVRIDGPQKHFRYCPDVNRQWIMEVDRELSIITKIVNS